MARTKSEARKRRKLQIRKSVRGTAERPRLTIYRSLNHVYAQVIDDEVQQTIVAASTQGRKSAGAFEGLSKKDQAKKIGEMVAGLCAKKGIQRVVFDRNGYKYHGRVQAVAAGAREGGLQF